MKKVPMCGMADLPTVVELLLSSCTNDNCSMLVQDLWDSLDLTITETRTKSKSVECIILD